MMVRENQPIRVLEVVFRMGWGGINKYLVDTLRHIDKTQFQVDFLIHVIDDPLHPYIKEIKDLGCQVFTCPDPRSHLFRPWYYAKAFRGILEKFGPYDIVHSHSPPFDGAVLHLAEKAGIPVRIVTSHTQPPLNEKRSELRWHHHLIRRAYHTVGQKWIHESATLGLGVSEGAAKHMFGSRWNEDKRWKILHCGIDLNPFQEHIDVEMIRQELGINSNDFVVGHIGRFSYEKNHSFIVDVAVKVLQSEPDIKFMLIGDGPLLPEIKNKVEALNLTSHFIFLGARSDVPRLILSTISIILLPSLHEGLGLVLVEAQASGIPCIFTSSITHEVDIINSLIHRIDPSEGADIWFQVIKEIKNNPPKITRTLALSLVKGSSFNIETSSKTLISLYNTQLNIFRTSNSNV